MLISNDARSLERELDRAVRELRRLGPAEPADGVVADTAHRLAQALADAAAEARREPRRTVPRLGDYALADQVAVTGRELVGVLAAGRSADLADAVAALTALRTATG